MHSLIEGSQISVFIGGSVAHSAVATTFIHGKITSETAKAIRIDNNGGHIWLPKKALVASGTDWFKLAKWFKFTPDVGRTVDQMISVGGISV